MEANAKLLKKKRIAHMHGKLSKSNFDEQKLPPDDFVYNIMKDMDTKNVISYKQSQERFKKRQDLSISEGQRSMNSTNQDSYCNKQVKKVLPKKSFPLMKKCQTSLKYLKKNRCIPKPRAHLGFVPKPQGKPVSYTEQEFECGNSSKVTKPKIIQSKAYSKIFQSDFIKNKDSNPEHYENTGSSLVAQDEVDCHSSSTDDDGAAFESFVQKVNEEGNDSSDSDSRLIIQRKKSRNKSKEKKKKRRSKPFSDNENNKHVPKITSIPLSDSSESQSKETFEVHNKSSKRKSDSPAGFRKRACKDPLESYNSESSKDPLSDMDTYNNYSSSDEDVSLDSTFLDNEIEVASNVNIDIPNVESKSKLSNHESNIETLTLNKHRPDHKLSSNHADLNSTEVEDMIDTVGSDTTESNDLLSCQTETTKSKPKYEVTCYVRLKRDPILDKKALTFCSTVDSSEDDCIVIEDSDDEKSTSHSTPSVINKTCQSIDLSQNAQNKGAEIQKSRSNSSSSTCDSLDAELDDCVIMCEVPKVGLDTSIKESNTISNSLCSESLSGTARPTSNISNVKNHSNGPSTSSVESLNLQNLQTNKEIDGSEQPLNLDKTADSASVCQEDGSKKVEEFNVQIVAVQSLVESSANPLETSAAESNEIEVIDLSDDDLDLQEIRIENKNSEDGTEHGTNDHSKISVQEKAVQPNVVENIPSEHNNETCESTTLLSEHHEQSSCAVQQNMPDPKILEILSKINFDCIKEVLNRTKLMDSNNKSSEVEICTSDNVLLPIENATTTNIERNSKIDKGIVDKIQDSSELIKEEVGSLNYPHKSSKRNDALVKMTNSTIESSCISSSESAIELSSKVMNSINNFQTPNLSLDGLVTAATDINTKLNNNCIKENISAETSSFESKTFQMVNAENRTETSVYNGNQENKAAPHLEPSENPLQNYAKRNEVCCDTTICDSYKTTELLKNSVPNERQPNSKTCVETMPLQIKISQGKDAGVPETVNTLKHEDIAAAKDIKETIKCEIPESPSDDLDTVATTFIQDLNPPNKKVVSLINLYKAEYAKYMQIKNTEVNVSAGLKLLHENQVKKLAHLRSSIQNLAKHDPCFYKVVQGDKIKTSNIKSEIVDKLEVKKISSQANSSKEREGGTTTDAKPPLKLNSAGTSREKLLRLMMDIKCAECGKPASARCQGCAEVYYCSPHCGELSWKQGHYKVCKR